jgi:hypothetical protein
MRARELCGRLGNGLRFAETGPRSAPARARSRAAVLAGWWRQMATGPGVYRTGLERARDLFASAVIILGSEAE